MEKIPYYPLRRVSDSFGGEIRQAVERVMDSGWFIRGAECEAFEHAFADFCGARYCVGVGNGLEALALILKGYVAMGRLQLGDAVIVPSNTFIATWLAVTAAGLIPMPAEPDASTCELNLSSVEFAYTHAEYSRLKVGAILAVHLYGRLAQMDRLRMFAENHGILLLEDSAQAHGAMMGESRGLLANRRAGALGNAAGFSFYPGKNLGALGDAGAVVTDDADLAAMVRKLANYGSGKKYVHEIAGENSRLDEIQAAVLSVKLRRLDADNEKRRSLAERYLAEMNNSLVRLPKMAETSRSENVWHIFPVHCAWRNELQEHLKKLGIETIIHYPTPPHLQKAFVLNYGAVGYPIAERLAKEELSLPLHPFMTESEIGRVIDGINSFSPNV